MQNEKAINGFEGTPENAAYAAPTLRILGSVAELTQGGSGTLVDGVNGTKK